MSTFVFDLDGTICSQEKSGEYHLAKPIVPMIEKVNKLFDEGHEILIFTARGMRTYGTRALAVQALGEMTANWLDDNGVRYTRLQFGKPPGDFYIDDKGISAEKFLEDFKL